MRRSIPALILIGGIGLSGLAFWEARRIDDERMRQALGTGADIRVDALHNKLLDASVPVEGLATFIATQKVLEPAEFHGYAVVARGEDPIIHLTWAPHITADQRKEFEANARGDTGLPDLAITERDADNRLAPAGERGEYYPVLLEERFGDPNVLIGFDHLSGPNRRKAIERARDAGMPIATSFVRPLPGDTAGDRYVLFWPVYRGGSIPNSVEDRRAAIIGFVTAAYRIEEMFDFAVNGLPPVKATLSVIFGQTPTITGTVPAVQRRLEDQKTVLGKTALGDDESGGLRVARSFEEFGQTWTLVFDYSPQFVSGLRSSAPWAYLGLGLVLTLSLVGYVVSQQRRQAAVEALVAERTRELHRASDQLTAIIESSPLATVVNDGETRVTYWNKAAERYFGYRADEVMGLKHPLVPAGEEASFFALIERMKNGEVLRGVETVRRRKDGSMVEAAISAAAFRDSSGGIQGFVYTVEDITERKLREAVERDTAERLQAVVDTAVDGIIMINAQGAALLFNPAAERLFGYSANEIIGRNINMLMPPPYAEEHDGYLGHYRGTGVRKIIGVGREVVGRRKDGTTFPMHLSVGEARQYGRPIFVGVVHDLTAEREADALLHRTQMLLSGIIESSDDAIVSKTLEGVVTSWNHAATSIFGYAAEEMVGHHISAIAVPGHEDDLTNILNEIRHGRRVEHYETQRRRKNGTIIDVSLTVSPLYDTQGNIIGASKIARDITERKILEQRIRHERDTAQRYLDVAGVMLIVLDAEGTVVMINRKGCEILGYDDAAEIVGKYWTDNFIPQRMRAELEDALRRLFGGGDPGMANYENPVLTRAGQERIIAWKNAVLRDDHGRPTGILSSGEDITDRKAAETELLRSREHLARVQQVARIGSTEVDLATGEAIWSEEVYRLLGVDEDAFEPGVDSFASAIHPDDRAAVREASLKGRRGEQAGPVEFRAVGSDGQTRWFHRNADFVRDGDGRPTRLIATMYDITERKIAEAARLASEEQYRLTFDLAPLGIAHVSLDGSYLLVNETLCHMLGMSREQMLATNFQSFTHPDFRAASDQQMNRLITGQQTVASWDKRYVRRDGRTVWCHITSVIKRDDAGNPLHFVSTYEDITQNVDAEARRLQLEEQLQQSQKMEAVGRLTGGVAHDFNNLLTIVLGNLELMRERVEGDAKMMRQIDSALSAGRRGADLTHRLLAFSRRQPLEPVVVDINSRIANLVPLLVRTLGEIIEVKQRLGSPLWKVVVDPGQFESAVMNLAVNARDAMPNGGKLEITTESLVVDEGYAAQRPGLATGRYVRVSVSDSGTGMPPEVVEKAFEPFFTTKEVGKGTGLGLSMVYGFVKQSGGHAGIYSEVGVGTTVTMLLPADPEDRAEVAAAVAKGTTKVGTETILVVEDDPDVRAVTISFLDALGYKTFDAGTVREGMELFAAHPSIAMILTDVILPGGQDGATLARRARTQRPDIRVLFMSGYTEDVVMHDGRLDAGVVLLRKPFTRAQLAEKVRAVLDAPPSMLAE